MKSENIILHFKGKSGKYMETKPLHGSQKSKWISKNLFEVKLELIINYELERLILSYGDDIEVVSPKSLKIRVIERLKHAISQYQ
jgi:predicted DNA-binding transcriptional regulator YafY